MEVTHLEPDILECEVKWALKSITTNKASGRDGIPVELFQILKDDAVKVRVARCREASFKVLTLAGVPFTPLWAQLLDLLGPAGRAGEDGQGRNDAEMGQRLEEQRGKAR